MAESRDPPGRQSCPAGGQPPAYDEGLLFGLPAIWLRTNCRCRQCRDPVTGERLVSITDLPDDVAVATAHRSGDQIEVVFSPDGHESAFDARWLSQFAATDPDPAGGSGGPGTVPPARPQAGGAGGRTEDAKRLWAGSEIASAFPQGSWELLKSDAAHQQACLEAVLRDGFVLLRDVPAEDGTVLTVARRFGCVRETEYGPVVDMRVSARPPAHVFTSQALEPRTGHACRDPLPTLQLMHYLRPASRGGDCMLIDSFHAAATLRAERPHAFEVLTSTDVTFAFADAVSDLTATAPVIGVDTRGRIREVRIDPALMEPLRLPPVKTVDFYQAYRAFTEVLRRPGQAVTFRMREGDCLIQDNTRILAGRTAFSGGAARHVQLCWAEIDGLASKLALLRRARQNGRSR